MVTPVCHESFILALADAAATTRKTAGANPKLPAGVRLKYLCVELPTGSGPCMVVPHIVVAGKGVELKAQWVRGGPNHGGSGALTWQGDIPIPEDTDLFIAIRNDTGGALSFTLHWITEKDT